jgi:hypothetical protein
MLPCSGTGTHSNKEETMKRKKEMMPEYPKYYQPDYSGRPLQYVTDTDGNGWLCDKGVDPKSDLKKQGCWRCDEVTFPYGGR